MNGFVSYINNFNELDTYQILSLLKYQNPNVSESIVKSWEVLLNDIFLCDSIRKFDSKIIIGIEYNVYVDNMGVDLFVYGQIDNKQTLFILESKQWDDEYIFSNEFSNYREESKILLPQRQISKHKIAIKKYLDIGEKIDDIITYVYIKNASEKGIEKLKQYGNKANSIFISNLDNFFNDILESKLIIGKMSVDDFKKCEYSPSIDVIKAMEGIINTDPCYILNEEQEKVLKRIIKEINNGKRIIQISGSAGSGKTAVLLQLYVTLLRQMNKTGLKPFLSTGGQNTHLYRSLYPDFDDLFCWTFSLQKRDSGYQRRILLIDEAQSNKNGVMSDLLSSGAIIVFCYDDKQVINLNNSLYELDLIANNKDYCNIMLSGSVRFNGSNYFDKNVRKFVYGSNDSFIEDDKYLFKICNSKEELFNEINYIEKTHNTMSISGLLCNNTDELLKKLDNRFFVKWNNKTEIEWVPYVRRKNYKHEFDGKYWIGTWWMPGIDVDYNIVILGNDVKYSKNGLEVIPENSKLYNAINSCLDFVSVPLEERKKGVCNNLSNFYEFTKLNENKKYLAEFNYLITKLIRNNYYIMLTRGRKGCVVYFVN